VRKAVEELNYRPSHLARSLPTGQSRTIGVYLPVIHGSFYTPMLNTIYSALRANDRRMMVAFGTETKDERKEVMDGTRFLVDHGCDGLAVLGTAIERSDLEYLLGLQPHLVLLNRSIGRYRSHCFTPDHEAGGRLAANALWSGGHRRIAVIGGETGALDNIARLKGFFDELAKHDVDVKGIPTVCGHFSPAGGRAAAKVLLTHEEQYTAIFCANDESAVGALSFLHEAGLSVPRDISVMGYDGLDLAAYTAPPLTTVRIPWPEICVSALNHLLNECYSLSLPVKRAFAAEVLWHDSVARVGAARLRAHNLGNVVDRRIPP
jgi:LacI family transcriptional regulator